MTDLASLSLTDASALIARREVSSLDLVNACAAQIERWEPHVRAIVARLDDQAIEGAKKADRELAAGTYRGPLHGLPIMVKDMIDVSGVATTASSQILRNNVASANAPVVSNLLDAGAIVTAKTNTHEFAYGALTAPTRNPWDTSRMPGGSSGGSGAAVASRMAFGALGTDTAGSIREPATLCGLVGLKPTYGRISKRGVIPLAWSLDTVGPMARSVSDCQLLFAGIEPYDSLDAASIAPDQRPPARPPVEVSSLRVAIAKELMEPLQLGVRESISDILGRLEQRGASIREVSVGDPDEILALVFVILGSEAAAFHRRWLETTPQLYGADTMPYVELGTAYSAMDYIDALRVRGKYQARMAEILTQHDVIITPGQMISAPSVDAEFALFPKRLKRPRDLTLVRPLVLFSLTGLPALTVPTGMDPEGLPVGLQLAAGPFQEEFLFSVGRIVEELSEWKTAAPPLPTSSLTS